MSSTQPFNQSATSQDHHRYQENNETNDLEGEKRNQQNKSSKRYHECWATIPGLFDFGGKYSHHEYDQHNSYNNPDGKKDNDRNFRDVWESHKNILVTYCCDEYRGFSGTKQEEVHC
jgi:hypothetical protein